MADKVKYGIKNVHYALLTNDTPTYETPVPIPARLVFLWKPVEILPHIMQMICSIS